MNLKASFIWLVAIFSFLLSSCTKEIVNTYVESLSTSGCLNKNSVSVGHYEPFEMSISDGKAECFVKCLRSAVGYDSLVVNVNSSQHHVKVVIEHYFSDESDDTVCYEDVAFTLADVPEEDFVFEIFSRSVYDIDGNHFFMGCKNPHLRESIHLGDSKNTNLKFLFNKYPDNYPM